MRRTPLRSMRREQADRVSDMLRAQGIANWVKLDPLTLKVTIEFDYENLEVVEEMIRCAVAHS